MCFEQNSLVPHTQTLLSRAASNESEEAPLQHRYELDAMLRRYVSILLASR